MKWHVRFLRSRASFPEGVPSGIFYPRGLLGHPVRSWILVRFPGGGSSTFQGRFFVGAEKGPGTQLPLETLSVSAALEDGPPEAVKQRAERAAVPGDVLGWLLSVTCRAPL